MQTCIHFFSKLLTCDFDGYAYEDETNNDTECSEHSKVSFESFDGILEYRTTRLY